MLMNNGYNQYKQNSINTSTPEELTLMLYNGLVKYIMQAQSALDAKNLESVNNSIIRAQDIVREFQSTLDMNYEVSQSMDILYDYMHRRLIEANINKDSTILTEILGMAKELRDTWAQAMKLAKHPASPVQTAVQKTTSSAAQTVAR